MFREISRWGVSKFGLRVPDNRRGGGGRYRQWPKPEPPVTPDKPLYIPPAAVTVAEEPLAEVQPISEPPAEVNIEVVAEKLKEHFESGDALAEPAEVQADEVNEGEYSLVLRWFPDTGFGDLRRSTGEVIGFAHWAISSVGVETIKPHKTWVRHHVETVQGKNGMRTVAADIYICKENDDD